MLRFGLFGYNFSPSLLQEGFLLNFKYSNDD
nr:MAG TPA: hypothetical protein [Caudoviricetes sp.]